MHIKPYPFSRTFSQPFLFDASTGAENPGAPNPATPPNPQPQNQPNNSLSPLERAVADVLARNSNDSGEALRVLVAQNHKLTERAETAEKRPVITTEIQAELYAYRAFGKPEEVKAKLDNESTLTAEKQTREKQDSLRDVAKVLGLKPNAVFLRYADGIEFVPVEADGKTTGYNVKTKDANGVEKTLSFEDFVKLPSSEEFREVLPAHKDEPESKGTPWPAQNSGPVRPNEAPPAHKPVVYRM